MTTPGGNFPDDTLGDDLAPIAGLSQSSWEADMRSKAITPYNNAHTNLADLLGQILQNLARAAMQGLGAIAQGFVDLFGAVVQGIGDFLNGLTSAILGQNPASGPPSVGSSFADIRDGQRALIDQVSQLGDNAGFCNLVQSKNWNIPNGLLGSSIRQKYLGHDFDTMVTQSKNAHAEMVNVPNSCLPFAGLPMNGYGGMRCHGIVFDAPGIWQVNSLVTLSIDSTDYRYWESSIFVFRLHDTGDFPGGYREAAETYTETRVTGTRTDNGTLFGITNIKSVLIPDDGHDYVAVCGSRLWANTYWHTHGGAVYSQFTVNRFSVDTTDYGTHDDATGTVTLG